MEFQEWKGIHWPVLRLLLVLGLGQEGSESPYTYSDLAWGPRLRSSPQPHPGVPAWAITVMCSPQSSPVIGAASPQQWNKRGCWVSQGRCRLGCVNAPGVLAEVATGSSPKPCQPDAWLDPALWVPEIATLHFCMHRNVAICSLRLFQV